MPQKKKTEPEAPVRPPKSSIQLRREYLATLDEEQRAEEREGAEKIKALRPLVEPVTA